MPTGTLFVVATPLGNLADVSERAADTLRTVPVVAAEDTRRTAALLARLSARPTVISYHAHSGPDRAETILDILRDGRDVALVTDAGTPAISDPGGDLVRRVRAAGGKVVPIPGPSAVATALSASGIAADRYLFLGFVPRKGEARRRMLERIATSPWSVVLFEAANRVVDLLDDLGVVCGEDRRAAIARELTKLHEDIRDGTLGELRTYYQEHEPLGEITVVVSGRDEETDVAVNEPEIHAAIAERLQAGDSPKDVVRMVTARFGLPRNEAYRMVTQQR